MEVQPRKNSSFWTPSESPYREGRTDITDKKGEVSDRSGAVCEHGTYPRMVQQTGRPSRLLEDAAGGNRTVIPGATRGRWESREAEQNKPISR